MSHLAIFVVPGYGHVGPTIELTRELVGRGHRVTYVIDEGYAGLVAEAGAHTVTYRSSRGRLAGQKSFEGADMAALFADFFTDGAETVLPLAESALADDKPDLILYDFGAFPAARMLARNWSVPTVQLFPQIASNDEFSLFGSPDAAIQVDEAAMAEFGRGYAALLGMANANGLTEADMPSFAAAYDDRNLVFLTRSFQPKGETFDERFVFVGPCFAAGADDGTVPGAWQPPQNDSKVLLASMGTESNEQAEFFRSFGEAFKDDEWHVVLTLGKGADAAELGLADHLEAHSFLPHPQVLPHAEVLVTHGGPGSVTEALHYGTPMVIVPQTPETRFNAQHVTELGLGTAILPEDLTAHGLRAAVDELAKDTRVRDNVARVSQESRDSGGAIRAAEVLEGWLAALPDAR
ncbi:glycosyl transferase [Streptomyces armeniacus]|uniref:Glycosyl transferase n=1 Tax=Streptomyces armeniacus TaxID=83291 RepID=A0A345XYB8_9ACTN|nr:macrolide family glycosyltransferase [Streptomyces armeniacus]AXK36634.1 glycosyl transferase [Streptomyces armeniacus]